MRRCNAEVKSSQKLLEQKATKMDGRVRVIDDITAEQVSFGSIMFCIILELFFPDINVSITIISINELSETDEALKVTAFLTISWIDEFMVWNASDYGNITYYQYPQVSKITNSGVNKTVTSK